jgi:hypothetical protein
MIGGEKTLEQEVLSQQDPTIIELQQEEILKKYWMDGSIYLIKMRRYLIIFLVLAFGQTIQAQVRENLLMERFNMNAFNPAYVGSEGREVSFTTRSSWQGVSGLLLLCPLLSCIYIQIADNHQFKFKYVH